MFIDQSGQVNRQTPKWQTHVPLQKRSTRRAPPQDSELEIDVTQASLGETPRSSLKDPTSNGSCAAGGDLTEAARRASAEACVEA
jgi:hypothetical protein